MQVVVFEENKKHFAEVSVDINGNMYIEINKEIYQICVDKKNKPYCDKGDYKILNTPDIIVGTLKDTSNPYSLKGNTIKKVKKEKEKIIEELDNIDDEIEYIDFLDHTSKYFCEDDECFEDYKCDNKDEEVDNFDETFEDTSNIKESFKFLTTPDFKLPIYERTNGEINATYDIIIRDGDLNKNKICFKTRLFIGETAHYSEYRLQLFSCGILSFREIGGKDKIYTFKLSKNGLELVYP